MELVFWPIAMDIKYHDIEALADQSIDITLFNGAVRNAENKHMALTLRKKSKLLIAYGSCAHLGGIPGLANFSDRDGIFARVYLDSESTDNATKTIPATAVKENGTILNLPEFFDEVHPLGDFVTVDYYMPGCPPQSERVMEVLGAVLQGVALPPRGSVVGAGTKSLCEECERKKSDNKKIRAIIRSHELQDDHETCFLEQGVICMGPATRSGCGARCIKGNAPCRGCYGPPAAALDPGAKMMSAIGTMIDANDPDEIDEIIDHLEEN